MLSGLKSKENPFFLPFGRDPLNPPQKLLSYKARYLGDEKVSLTQKKSDIPFQ